MRFGFHISIRGGLPRVIERAEKLHCQTIQIFARNPRGWRYRKIPVAEARKFQSLIQTHHFFPLIIHSPYVVNLASPDHRIQHYSLRTLREELKRAKLLGAQYVVMHAGNRIHTSEKEAVRRVIQSINKVLTNYQDEVVLLVENTAGQGSEIGYSFAQLKAILSGIENKKAVGICLDTAHLFAAGYDIRTKMYVENMLDKFERSIGLTKLHLLHLNDSKNPLGSHIDRHWHIGEGEIGSKAFYSIINHPLLAKLSAIIETPRQSDADDEKNMSRVTSLRSSLADNV